MKRRILALFLACGMLVGMLPVQAFAEEMEDSESTSQKQVEETGEELVLPVLWLVSTARRSLSNSCKM